ncbi:hypothetical protein CEXT_291991 [Caerostris extrusa]|uniref:Uncharacterized protein n=1 Tax=Caerostris extrusa TaxID=172846 RepID=A0AAV4TNB0_CAEEX|nr:hypothetical protein CEXT_291991 [Caerostris extrusa]
MLQMLLKSVLPLRPIILYAMPSTAISTTFYAPDIRAYYLRDLPVTFRQKFFNENANTVFRQIIFRPQNGILSNVVLSKFPSKPSSGKIIFSSPPMITLPDPSHQANKTPLPPERKINMYFPYLASISKPIY